MSEPSRNHTDQNLQEIVFFNDVIEILFCERSLIDISRVVFAHVLLFGWYKILSLSKFRGIFYPTIFFLKKRIRSFVGFWFFSLTCASAWLCFIDVATFHVACWKSPFHVGSEICHQKSISRAHTECLLTNTLVVQISVTLDSMRVKWSRVKNTLT